MKKIISTPLIILFAITLFSCGKQPTINGKWRSCSHPNYVIEFDGNIITEYNKGEIEESYTFKTENINAKAIRIITKTDKALVLFINQNTIELEGIGKFKREKH